MGKEEANLEDIKNELFDLAISLNGVAGLFKVQSATSGYTPTPEETSGIGVLLEKIANELLSIQAKIPVENLK